MTDFNGVSNRLWLFDAYRFENRINCMLIFKFHCIETGTITPGETEPGSDGNNRILHTYQSSRTIASLSHAEDTVDRAKIVCR